MTGPAHYLEAEKHLEQARTAEAGGNAERYNLAAAQVHATLALAAATALPAGLFEEWQAAAESRKPGQAS